MNILRKVYTDMYLLSGCDYVLVTWPSNLGKMMCNLVREEQCGKVLNWNYPHKDKPIPE
jgi:hypothetical protein